MSQPTIESTGYQAQVLMAAWGRAYGKGRSPSPALDLVTPQTVVSRGEGDVWAAWQRWHDTALDDRFVEAEWPWYALLERARVESLASQHLPGMARNLDQLDVLSPNEPIMAHLYQAARQILARQTDIVPRSIEQALKQQITEPTSTQLRLGLRWPWQPTPVYPEPEKPSTPVSDADIAEALCSARDLLRDGPGFAEALYPLIQALAAAYEPYEPSAPALTPTPADHNATPESNSASDEEHPDAQVERSGGHHQSDITELFPDYAVFSTAWDEEYPAAHWYQATDAEGLQALNTLDRRKTRQLAHRLQRRLLAARLRHWSFDQEEGRLDNRRLARLVGSNPSRHVFRVENESPVPEACVTLLVDQSGSMRGMRQLLTALAIDLVVHTLELCQVRCEVLGYTTRFWADNPISQRWQQKGSPSSPGRLNALRHIVYKPAEQPWRRARPYLGLLLREGFGYENIDGEALHWAARRLMRQPQTRRIIVVLSDGAPYDEATVRANGRGFLDGHLRTVIAEIEASPIQLVALGTGQAVGRYYRQSVTVRRPEAVAEALFERLGDLLTQVYPSENIL
jgi:cobaltochelatase CobT